MFIKCFIQFSLFIFICAASNAHTPTLFETWCNGTAPSSVEIRDDFWKLDLPVEMPNKDDLDRYMIHKTGCKYRAVKYALGFYPLEAKKKRGEEYAPTTYDGSVFEWRGAVRARDEGLIQVNWGKGSHFVTYNFFIGEDGNTNTTMFQYGTYNTWTLYTPGILSIHRYVPFYLKIQEGVLTFSKDCVSEPLFSHNVTINRGERLQMYCKSWSQIGAKFLYDCPIEASNIRGSSSRLIVNSWHASLSTFIYLVILVAGRH